MSSWLIFFVLIFFLDIAETAGIVLFIFINLTVQKDADMRVYTRGDMDGLTSVVLLTYAEDVKELFFAHPKDMQDGLIDVQENDIITNLPYAEGCALWFDHHTSEKDKLDDIGEFSGRFELAPSAARVIYNHYKLPEFEQHIDMLESTDKLDSAHLTEGEVTTPTGWILLGLTLDPRSGLGPDFRKYFRWLAEYVKELPLEQVLEHREVKKRIDRVLTEQKDFKRLLSEKSRLEDNVIITDLRETDMSTVPVGNRFLVFTMFPEGNVEARIFKGIRNTTVIAAGKSIFNRTFDMNIGKFLAEYGGGGHEGAGTVQFPDEKADELIPEIIGKLKQN